MVQAPPLPRKELNLYPIDYPFETLVSKIDNKSLILDPDFQRKYKWDDEKASFLVESCLMQVPLPSCYFGEDDSKNHFVIDGVQRLQSIYRFIKNNFALQGLQTYKELNGKKFVDLEQRIRRHIETYTIRCIVLRNDNDPIIIRDLFSRLNQSSVELSAQEIRHALYSGNLDKLLEKLSCKQEIQDLISGQSKKDDRTTEELVLRFFALNNNLKDYDDKLKKYLDDYMMRYRNISEEEAFKMEQNFLSTLEKCRLVFGKDIFSDFTKARARKSIAHYDLQMYRLQTYSEQYLKEHKKSIIESYKRLCTNDSFQKTLTSGIAQKQSILKRRELWQELLKSI